MKTLLKMKTIYKKGALLCVTHSRIIQRRTNGQGQSDVSVSRKFVPIYWLNSRLFGGIVPVKAAALFVLLALALPGRLFAADEQTFSSPDQAVQALLSAASVHDTNAMHAIFGPEGHQLASPDPVQATNEFKMFSQRLKEKVQFHTNSDSSFTLELGPDAWPFPIPLVKQGDQWHFDTSAGKAEILNRRVGMDELGAINICGAYVDAQKEYASQDRTGDGVFAYARLLRSTQGLHDGLYWPAKPGEPLSPFGPLIAAAHVEGYHHISTSLSTEQAPYHGYYFKILTRQGKHAPGGKYNYIINGRMIAGFGLVAWPAEWGNTGVMTFIVNQQGKVYQCNLGPKTAKVAAEMKQFDPDKRWTVVK